MVLYVTVQGQRLNYATDMSDYTVTIGKEYVS
jgi:hypothetical protein